MFHQLMKRSLGFLSGISFLVLTLLSAGVPCVYAADNQETWVDDKAEKIRKADIFSSELLEAKSQRAPRKESNFRWRIFGKLGYQFDDNVPLASAVKDQRVTVEDTNAGRYTTGLGVSGDYLTQPGQRAGASYYVQQSLHDDGLDEYNYQYHAARTWYEWMTQLADRPLGAKVSYQFSHGLLDRSTYSSGHTWRGDASWEFAQNHIAGMYQALEALNYRDKGYDRSIAARDGFYEQTGLLYTYLFDQRRRRVYFGYEFSLAETRGNNYDGLFNGFRVGFKTPLIEKVQLETYYLFQTAYYRHFVTDPKRTDLRNQFEVRLSRSLLKNWEATAFYRRTDVRNTHEGVLGHFSYERNIGGVELTFSYD